MPSFRTADTLRYGFSAHGTGFHAHTVIITLAEVNIPKSNPSPFLFAASDLPATGPGINSALPLSNRLKTITLIGALNS